MVKISDRELIEKLEDRKFAKKWVKGNKKNRIAFITGLAIKTDSTAALKNLLGCGVRIG